MTPSVSQLLMVSAGEIGSLFVPNLPERFMQGAAQLSALMNMLAAQEAERGAEVRIRDNAEMRGLFAELAPLASKDLRAELIAAAGSRDSDFRLSALDAANAVLRGLLIALHEEVDALDGAAGLAANARIWAVLKASAVRREFHLAPG